MRRLHIGLFSKRLVLSGFALSIGAGYTDGHDASGFGNVSLGSALEAFHDEAHYAAGLKPVNYRVVWRALSLDTRCTQDSFPFAVRPK